MPFRATWSQENNPRIAVAIKMALGVEMPITEQTYRVLYEGLGPSVAVRNLLSRQARPE